jgi:Zn-dependent membrane protease YugP
MQGIGIYVALIILPMLLALYAQWKVKSAYARADAVPASSGYSGADVARMILQASNITGVKIERTHGVLSDHYDPRQKVLRLSERVYDGRTSAALGIAAHEAGHAIQDATNYAPLVIRNGIVPMAMVGNFGLFLCGIGVMVAMIAGQMGPAAQYLLIGGIVLFSAVVVFQLINLPVEFDASKRARRLLQQSNLIRPGAEAAAMNGMLSAAAMTYVAATIAAIGTLLYYVLILLNSQQRN